MADAEDIAGKVLDVVGGIGGGIVGIFGGAESAKGVMTGVGAIKSIVGDATGSNERKRAEADAKEKERRQAEQAEREKELALREREIALREREAERQAKERERDKIRDFDAPMYPARRRPAVEARTWQPTELREGDRIVDIVATDERTSPPLVEDARQSTLLRRGSSADVLLIDEGPLVDGAQAPTSADAGRFPLQVNASPASPVSLARRADASRFELAGDPHADMERDPVAVTASSTSLNQRSKEG